MNVANNDCRFNKLCGSHLKYDDIKLVVTQGYGMRVITIEGQNAFAPGLCFCVISTRQMVKTRVIRLRVIKGPNACDQSAFCAFHKFLVEVQTNASYIHATHA